MRSEDMSKRFVLILPHVVTTFPMAPHISIEDTGFQMALPREGLFQGPRQGEPSLGCRSQTCPRLSFLGQKRCGSALKPSITANAV